MKAADANDIVRNGGSSVLRELIDAAERWDPSSINGSSAAERDDFPLVRASAWQGIAVPPRRWLVPNRLPLAKVTMLYGDGGMGKTTITLQLCVATVRGTDWLGSIIDEPGPVIFFSAEEDEDEIHRRLAAIIEHQGVAFHELHDLHVRCMADLDAVLGAPDSAEAIQPTTLLKALDRAAREIRPSLIAIEAAADVYAGKESVRTQVRQFMAILRRLAINSGAAVLLLAHPSVSGMANGKGTSGSTHWSNAARSRLYFASAKTTDDETESDVRELKVMKANYGPEGEVVRVRWQCGLFLPLTSPSAIERAAAENAADEVFLRCLDVKQSQGIEVGPMPGRNYAPAIFAGMELAKGYKKETLKQSMEHLLNAERIRADGVGPPSKRKTVLVRAN